MTRDGITDLSETYDLYIIQEIQNPKRIIKMFPKLI